VTIREQDLKDLLRLQKKLEQGKETLQRLRDRSGVKSPSLTGMPHGSGPHDRTGELVPAIVDLENELELMEQEYWQLRLRVGNWIDAQEDQKAAIILGLRYLDGYGWDRISKEMRTGAESISADAARKYLKLFLKNAIGNDEESNGQEGR